MRPTYLKQFDGRTYYAVLEIPKSVRSVFGKARFKESLKTESRSEAERRAMIVVGDWKREIEFARSGKRNSIEGKVFAWNRLKEADLQSGATIEEVKDMSLDVIDHHDEEQVLVHDIVFGNKFLLKDHIEDSLKMKSGITDKTRDMLVKDMKDFVVAFPVSDQVSKKAVKAWVRDELKQKRGLSETTCKRIISACRGLWDYLVEYKDLEAVDPFGGVFGKSKKGGKSKQGFSGKRKAFNKADISKLLKGLSEFESDRQLSSLIWLGAHTGARIEELCSLKLENVHSDYFEIVDAKSEAGWRKIPIHPDISELVEHLKQASADGYLLSGLSKNKYGNRSNAIGKRFGRHKKKLGYGPDYVFHSIRKCVATQLETNNIQENIAAKLLGHEFNTMTYGLYSGEIELKVLSDAIRVLDFELR